MPPHLPHESNLNQNLRALLTQQRVAALGTLDEDGAPFVSMVPFAVDPASATLVIHVSMLAPHTRHLLARPQVSLLVMQPQGEDSSVLALPRVTFQGRAYALAVDSRPWTDARLAYLTRFVEAEPMTHFGDFQFIGITVDTARQVSGFGAARSLDANELSVVLSPQR
jgi:putative heme iron utilization protein